MTLLFLFAVARRLPASAAYTAFLTVFCLIAIVAQIRSIRKG